MIDATPNDYSCYNNIGYIHRKLGHKQEAVKIFEELTDLYAEQGFLLKAIATCKVVMDIDPTHKEIQHKLADLYAKRSDRSSVAVKVMTDDDSQAQIGAQALAPNSPTEVQLSDQDEEGFGIVLTTPLEALEVMEIPMDAGLAEPEQESQPSPAAGYGEVDFSEPEQIGEDVFAQPEPLPEEPQQPVEAEEDVAEIVKEEEEAVEEEEGEVMDEIDLDMVEF
ncbi:MAG: hypothetical protein JRJ87_17010, partial [Deltaproteobacteria bacterium]|nr:hypothetical protein [Deltaproteobacteria bacterium]